MTAADSPGPIGRTPRQVAGPTVDPEQEDEAGESPIVDLRERPGSDPDLQVDPEPTGDADPEVEGEPSSGPDPVEVEPASGLDPDPEVEPLPGFMGETGELRRQWEAVQASFVDDPRRAVEQADEMVSVAVAALQAHIEQRREDLAETWRGAQQASTDALLTAFQSYREMFEGVLST